MEVDELAVVAGGKARGKGGGRGKGASPGCWQCGQLGHRTVTLTVASLSMQIRLKRCKDRWTPHPEFPWGEGTDRKEKFHWKSDDPQVNSVLISSDLGR